MAYRNHSFRFCAAILLLSVTSTARAAVIDDFSSSNPGNYSFVELFSGDATNNFNASGGAFAPNHTSQETEAWLWTGDSERLDVGETVSLDVLTVESDGSEAVIVLGVTSTLSGSVAAEFRLQNVGGTGTMITRTDFGADNNNVLAGTFGASTIEVTRSADTTFDWEVTGSLTGSGSVSWANAAGNALFFGLENFNASGSSANQMDNLALTSSSGTPEPASFVLVAFGLVFGLCVPTPTSLGSK